MTEAALTLTQAGSDPLPPAMSHTVKKFSPDPNEWFLKMRLGLQVGLGLWLPVRDQESSPQEIITVRYFPDFSRTPGSKGKGLVRK